MSFFPHYAPFFLFSAPSKWNVFFRITEIGAHKLRLHAPFTMDIIKGRLLFDAFSDVFMSCICFADTVNICGNKHIFIVIVIVIVKVHRFYHVMPDVMRMHIVTNTSAALMSGNASFISKNTTCRETANENMCCVTQSIFFYYHSVGHLFKLYKSRTWMSYC